MYSHANYPYDELIKVPLIVRRPEYKPEKIEEQRELLDIAPTIAKLHGIETDKYDFLGTNLFDGERRDVISLGQPNGAEPSVTIRDYPWKYIHSQNNPQLYNLADDPLEQNNILESNQKIKSKLHDKIPSYLEARDIRKIKEPENEVDKEILKQLGYIE